LPGAGSLAETSHAALLLQVRHRLSVTPVVSPPQRIGDLSKKIFRKQVVSILEDLRAELRSRLNGEL
jgi:hypothetical protein